MHRAGAEQEQGLEVLMPALVDGMTEGVVAAWLRDDGDAVSVGDDLVEIETDKATVAVATEHAGRLRQVVAAGASCPVGAPIAVIGGASAAPPRASPVARRMAQHHGIDLATLAPRPGSVRIGRAEVEAAIAAGEASSADDRVAAPAVAEPAAPASAVAAHAGGSSTAREPSANGASGRGAIERIPLTRAQRVVADRMVAACNEIPSFTVRADVAMDGCAELRAEARRAELTAPSYNDLVVKACALALGEHPKLNGSYRGDAFELYERVNVGIAVAGEGTLVVPTLRDADRRSLADLSAEARRLAFAVRDGSITPAELAGGTFTVSNLGMFDVDAFTAVINAPQAAILAVGAVRERDGAGSGRTVATLTLTCDHRIVYGADAAAFLRDVRRRLEHPLALLLA